MSKRSRQGLAWYSSNGRNNLALWLSIFDMFKYIIPVDWNMRRMEIRNILRAIIHHIRRKL